MQRFLISNIPRMFNVVYLIESPSGRFYVGSTINLIDRMYQYNINSKAFKKQTLIYRSFIKYGKDNHKFYVLEEGILLNDLLKRERFWGDVYNVLTPESGMNCMLPGYSDIPKVVSEATKIKISNTLRGRKIPKDSLEKRVKSQTGLKRTTEFCKQMAELNYKRVIDTISGKIWESTIACAKECNIPVGNLRRYLNPNNGRVNKTTFEYLD